MRQLFQHQNTGALSIEEVPVPVVGDTSVLVRTHYSVISAGTEKTKVALGRKSLMQKALARPDLVRKVLDKARKEGIAKTVHAVRDRLDAYDPLGYSSAGVIEEAGAAAVGLQPGMRVACAGAGYANHADYAAVPHSLAVPVPDRVSLEEAAFTTLGAIALQGVRLADPKMGERFLVIGLGLIGQLTVQLLMANGCTVLGYDLSEDLVARAAGFGALPVPAAGNPVEVSRAASGGRGVDGVIICAGSASNHPIEWAGEATRDKGRVVVVGAVRMDVPREPYYRKEISLVISRSYGPGRYDPDYEEHGRDYPFGYVRFTEKRNMETFLDLVAQKKVDVAALITHRFDLADSAAAYALIGGNRPEPYLGVMLTYGGHGAPRGAQSVAPKTVSTDDRIGVYVLGAGNYATGVLLPVVQARPDMAVRGIATGSGRGASRAASKLGVAAGQPGDAFTHADVDLVAVLTRHDSHADYVCRGLVAGRHVYVEKPLALTLEELAAIRVAWAAHPDRLLMVGFNRSFAPLTRQVLDHLPASLGPKTMLIRVNAGALPADHWLNDPAQGGGRLIGEACHFVDFAATLAGSPVVSVMGRALGANDTSARTAENAALVLGFADGSVATILYTARGSERLAKEYVEVHAGGRSAVIEDFQNGRLHGPDGTTRIGTGRQDKGQAAMIAALADGLRSGTAPQAQEMLMATSMATILAVESLSRGYALPVDPALLDEGSTATTA